MYFGGYESSSWAVLSERTPRLWKFQKETSIDNRLLLRVREAQLDIERSKTYNIRRLL